jgi:hypothetical protein
VAAEGGYDAVAEFDQVWLSDQRIGIIPFFGTSRLVEKHVPFTCEAHILRAVAMLGSGGAGWTSNVPRALLRWRRC